MVRHGHTAADTASCSGRNTWAGELSGSRSSQQLSTHSHCCRTRGQDGGSDPCPLQQQNPTSSSQFRRRRQRSLAHRYSWNLAALLCVVLGSSMVTSQGTLPPPPRLSPPPRFPSPPKPSPPPRPAPSPPKTLSPKPGPGPRGDAFPPAPPEHPTFPTLPPAKMYPPAPPAGDPRIVGSYTQIGLSMIVGVHLVQIPGTDKYLFMERPSGYHPDKSRTIAGFMDVTNAEWTHVESPDGLFCCGHTLLDSGDVLIVGGHQANAGYPDGMKSVRTFNRSTTDLQLRKIRDMGWRRWYPTATLLPDGKVVIMGGTQGVGAGTANNPFWEILNPSTWDIQQLPMRIDYLANAKQVYYPFNYVLPSGFMFTFCGRWGYIMDWRTNNWFQLLPNLRGYATTQFPFTGTSLMLGLYPENNYQVEVMLFGGAPERAIRNLDTFSNKNSNRIKLTWDAASRNYSFDGWKSEQMLSNRVMPDVVLLPNGKAVILNGAGKGLAGDSAGGGESRAEYPVFFAELYDPTAPEGQRFRKMAPTYVARMYHSTAGLTTDGTVVVAGCDRCYKFAVTPGTFYEPSEFSKAEYRVEIFSPPYFYQPTLKPQIIALQIATMQYGQPFLIRYHFPDAPASANYRVTRAVLVAPSSCTHSYNTNQRLIGLEIINDDIVNGVLVVRGPPSIYIAVPQMYMLFLLNGDVYGSAKWVTLPRPSSGPALQTYPA